MLDSKGATERYREGLERGHYILEEAYKES
jgi:hypothetical protein